MVFIKSKGKTERDSHKKARKKIVILGAGPAGLCAAYNLLDDFDITILEKDQNVAGLASTFKLNGRTIPKYYHHIFYHDYLTRKYFEKVANIKDLRWKKIKVGICVNKKVYGFTDPFSLLRFDYLSFSGRIRYGLFGAYVLFFMNPNKIPDNMDARKWLLKYAGKEVTDKIFFHLYSRNKFNIPLNRISAKQFAFRIKEKEVKGIFGFPKKGLNALFEGFEKIIVKKKGVIQKKINIISTDLLQKEIFFEDENSVIKKMNYDILINTIPVPEFLKIQKGLPGDYQKRISQIKYCPVVCVTFGTEDFLNDYYWLNIFNERIHLIMQHSILNDQFNYKVNWASRYGGSEQDLDLSDNEIMKEYLDAVKKFFPDAKIKWAKVFKEEYAEPIYDKEYFKKNPGYKTPVKDFYFAGIAVTYPKIRNINTALESGEIVAKLVKEDNRVK